jgi:hypothetical protein
MKKLIIYSIILVLVYGCQSTTGPDRNAVKLTIQELNQTPGYEWYELEYNKFSPNAALITQITQNYKNNQFFLYVNPSCACTGTYKVFPSIMKCLLSAGVPEANINIYSMLDAGYNHNMMSKFSVNSLPQCFCEKTTTNYYSVVDSLNIYTALNPKDTASIIERMILNSLK